ncbi:MAG: L,D-transpeptidase family protein [Mucilaginibacter sp.]
MVHAQERVSPDTSVAAIIQKQFGERQVSASLYYPSAVKRFYTARQFSPVWVVKQKNQKSTWAAMLMIDCVLQYGLAHEDYHPKELLYDKLHLILEEPEKITNLQKARFDIILTDAMINLVNNLHFGKLNPYYTSARIDSEMINGFDAAQVLTLALGEADLMNNINAVQPRSKQYQDLQYQMYLIKEVYTGDCYETPEADVRRIAINMERLRWVGIEGDSYIQINIPSYSLTYYRPDTSYQFKVVVGKPSTPTPTLESMITHFTSAPEWKVPAKIFRKELLPKAIRDTAFLMNNHYAIYDRQGRFVDDRASLLLVKKNPENYYMTQSSGCDNALGLVVFRFKNIYDIYLHDTPEQKLFAKKERAFSHGCIRVEQAQKLAALLLNHDGTPGKIFTLLQAINNYQTKNFVLKTPVPIKVTYLTCEVINGYPVVYKDIYDLDERLEMQLYNIGQNLSKR